MKLRKRFWGVLGSLALVAGRVHAGDARAADRPAQTPTKTSSQNQLVANDLAAAIAREVPDSGYTVHVQFRGGVAMLSGNVANPSQLHRILQAVRSRPGVQRVVNQIKVGDGSIRTVSYQEEVVPGPVPAPMPAPGAPMEIQGVPGSPGQALTPVAPEYVFPQGAAPQYDAPFLPPFAWPARAPYPNYTAVQYPKHYGSTAWPHIGPFHPYPEPPLDWRKAKLFTMSGLKPIHGSQDPPPEWHCVKLRWEDGHWYLSFKQAWWAKRGFLNSVCNPQPDDMPIGCGTHMGCGYHLWFPQPLCTHMFTN
jgi:hypothetical protein